MPPRGKKHPPTRKFTAESYARLCAGARQGGLNRARRLPRYRQHAIAVKGGKARARRAKRKIKLIHKVVRRTRRKKRLSLLPALLAVLPGIKK